MSKYKLGQWLLSLILILATVGTFTLSGQRLTMPIEATAATVDGKGKPSAAPIGMFGFYINSGFSLQPTDQSSFVGHSKTMTTAAVHSMLNSINLLGRENFQWYQLTDTGAKWTKVSGGTKANLTVTPTQAGTVYYQQTFQYYALTGLLSSTYYSNVVAFKTLDHPIDATSLQVTADSAYLYNNQSVAASTTLHATPTPADATGNITWNIDNPTLATIDTTTGVVTANRSGNSGTVKVTATMTNEDGTPISGSTTIEIGGGLEDQHVTVGQAATFSIKGTSEATPTKVVWHKIDTKGKDTVIANQSGMTYTTPATTNADNQTKVYAAMSFPDSDGTESSKKESVITTNQATLTVLPNLNPQVTITSSMTNLATDTGNTEHHLTNVIAGDSVQISGTFGDSNPDSSLTSGDFAITLPGDATDTSLLIDGQMPIQNPPMADGNGNVVIKVTNINFIDHQTHTFQLGFSSHTVTNKTLTTAVKLTGHNANGTEIGSYSGPDLIIDFIDGALHATAANVDFGNLTYANVGQKITGTVNADNLLTVTDNRRDKVRSVITLRQNGAFNNGNHDLAATLFMTEGDTSLALTNSEQTVVVANKGDTVPSVSSKNNQYLKLQLGNAAIIPGNYTTTLDWAVTAAP
ncbi:hypothetical protein ACFP1L_12960 [Lactiplantibacillus nangangensis]|uniref:BIG2 domain-containing protein n=1 Tax=Lactiplantibacillus nangangensis TaxID=2559917 RepID=A0ABW1SM19_9LACO|nr:hypothetical protein [Lactiplantibacillus nangangensis]